MVEPLAFQELFFDDLYLVNIITAGRTLPLALSIAIYVYFFLLLVNVFRVLFSYSQWVFPKLELESNRSSMLQHRTVWYAIVIGVLGSALWDGIKALW